MAGERPSGERDGVTTLTGRAPDRSDPVERLAASYTDSAAAYARLWGPTIRPLGLPMLDALPLDRAERVVDVGTGSGELLPHLRARAPWAEVLGVDRSAGMLEEAHSRGREPLALMDARALAARGQTVDVVTLVFVLFHLPRPLRALKEVRRVLRPGGTVGLVTWAGENPPLPGDRIWAEELDRLGAAPDPRGESVRRYAAVDAPDKLQGLLAAAGFPATRAWTRRFERRWELGDLVEVRRWCGPSGRRLASLAGWKRERCVARVRQRLTELGPEALAWRPKVVFAVGKRPEEPAGDHRRSRLFTGDRTCPIHRSSSS